MKKILILIMLVFVFCLIGCSSIPFEDREHFCNEKGMETHTEFDDKFTCLISDLDYIETKFKDAETFHNKNHHNIVGIQVTNKTLVDFCKDISENQDAIHQEIYGIHFCFWNWTEDYGFQYYRILDINMKK